MPTQAPLTPASVASDEQPVALKEDAVTATRKELERLSINFLNALNAHDYDFNQSPGAEEAGASVSSDWRAMFDTVNNAQPVSFDEQVQAWKQRAIANPDVRFELRDISSTADLGKGRASVFCEMEVSGLGGVMLVAMNEMKWRRDSDGKWECYFVLGFRGSSMNSGYG